MTDRLRSITELPGRLSAWALALPPVRWLQPIMDDYTEAGGGLLASGLAFNSLFAILPAILLLVSILGLLLQDPAALDEVIRALSNQFPPLAEFFEIALSGFTAGAVSFSIIGLIGLVWGSSRFYQSLDMAIARIFQGSRRRDPLQRGIRGVLSVLMLIGAVILVVILREFLQGVAADQPAIGFGRSFLASTLGSAALTGVVFTIAVAVVYRIVPTETPSWRAVTVPAVAVGLALAVLTEIFALITPRLVGSLRVYGAFVAVFAAMIWLSYVAQAILLGAAWVHRRARPPAEAMEGFPPA